MIVFLVRECAATFQFIEIFAGILEGGYCLLVGDLLEMRKIQRTKLLKLNLARILSKMKSAENNVEVSRQ